MAASGSQAEDPPHTYLGSELLGLFWACKSWNRLSLNDDISSMYCGEVDEIYSVWSVFISTYLSYHNVSYTRPTCLEGHQSPHL